MLARKPGYDPQLRAALTLAVTGSPNEAETISSDLSTKNPEHTIINSIFVPMVRAAIELSCDQPARALEQLAIVAPYELGFVAALGPIYFRAQAYSMLGPFLKPPVNISGLSNTAGRIRFRHSIRLLSSIWRVFTQRLAIPPRVLITTTNL